MRLLTCEKYDLNSIFHLFNYNVQTDMKLEI